MRALWPVSVVIFALLSVACSSTRGRAIAAKEPTPMHYVMKQQFFSWGNDFTIKDASGNDAFIVDGKAFSFGQQLSFKDVAGNELLYIKERMLAWGPTYEIYKGDEVQAVVKKKLFTLFKCRFTVDVPGPDDLQAEGNFFDSEYKFSRGERRVALVSKRSFSLTDTYGVDITEGEDDALILASAVVIDMACHQEHAPPSAGQTTTI